MKKIININLAGRVIPIEDSAYERLQAYIESLRRYFVMEEGRDEIINEIESRIAELMNDKVRKGAASVTDADIDEIISSMGRPEDFAAEDAADATTGSTFTAGSSESAKSTFKKPRGRLYRNMSDRFLGGVCSGVANYLNVDPAIIRLLFAIITFGGFGFGVILYILLWIILPAKPLEDFQGKRLFRNPDDKIIGGVAGGLSAYFNKEAWIIRLIFAAPLLLNIIVSMFNSAFYDFNPFPFLLFGSLSGTFVLAYIILWIVLPEAKSPYEKMEMRGEKVDVNTIRQNVQEGMAQFKDRATTFGQEVESSAKQFGARAQEFANTRGKTFATEVGQAAKPIGTGLGNAIRVLFKLFFLLVAGSIAFALFIMLIVLIFGGVGMMPLKNFLLEGFWQNALAWGTLILFLGVPLIAFITWLIRRVMKVRSHHNYLGWMFGGLWTLGWIAAAFFAASIARELNTYEGVQETIEITQPLNGRMLVKVNEPELRLNNNFWWIDDDGTGWNVDEDTMRIANVKIRISKSIDSAYHVIEHKASAGRTRSDAERRAERIQYNISSQDSILNLGSGLAIDRDSKFRGQEVVVEIMVPVGKRIRFDETVDERLHPYSIRTKGNYDRRRSWGRDGWEIEFDYDRYFNWELNTDYVMTENGTLVNPDKELEEDSDKSDTTYRYDSEEQRRREYEEQKRRAEEEQRKLQEMERKLRSDTIRTTTSVTKSSIRKSAVIKEGFTDDEEKKGLTFIHSPVFSFVKASL